MQVISVNCCSIEEIKIIKFKRFIDERGFFCEKFRTQTIETNNDLDFLKGLVFSQSNESFSRKNVLRGMHFQWEPFMGKLVRCISGRLIDIALDIRPNSKTFGKITAAVLDGTIGNDYSEWIWLPPGFAHGAFLTEDSIIEYQCTGHYNPQGEASVSPFANDIDWSLCPIEIRNEFEERKNDIIIKDRDREGMTLSQWLENDNSKRFEYFGDK